MRIIDLYELRADFNDYLDNKYGYLLVDDVEYGASQILTDLDEDKYTAMFQRYIDDKIIYGEIKEINGEYFDIRRDED